MSDRKILIIDPDPTFRRNARRFLVDRGFQVEEAETGAVGIERMRASAADFALVDLQLERPGGAEVVRQLISISPTCGVVCAAAKAKVDDVVAAMKAGALDVFERPVEGERLLRMYEDSKRHLLRSSANESPAVLGTPAVPAVPVNLPRMPPVDLLVSKSQSMKSAMSRLQRMAGEETAVLLFGEHGVGVAPLAKFIHSVGPRSGGPFVTVPAQPENATAEELLFGSSRVASAFAQAKGGVVFIESLASLGESGQERLAKLLQGLAASKVQGGVVSWPPMILGSESSAPSEPSSGLRKDLVQLLERSSVRVPALQQRKEDLGELVRRMVAAIASQVGAKDFEVSSSVLDALSKRPFDQNIAELIRVVKDSAVQDADGRLFLDLSVRPPPEPKKPEPIIVKEPEGWAPTLDDEGQVQPYDVYEAEIFRFALKKAGGCVSRAATLLGVGRATMYRKMRTYEIDVPPVSERAISRNRRKKSQVARPS